MSHKIRVLFYGNKSRATKEAQIPIYMRIPVNGVRISDHATGKFIEPSNWSMAAGKAKGSGDNIRITNNFLDALRNCSEHITVTQR